eukprot:GFYU01003725.1.p1 GENE.GFYU01003725.1~~GFYU01003725.1.p1  ORF type:complete len:1448 (+),score=389.90 GFYU01003725.1:187-4530(+)
MGKAEYADAAQTSESEYSSSEGTTPRTEDDEDVDTLKKTFPPIETTSSVISQLLLSWVDELMSRGAKKPLAFEDLWTLPKDETTVEMIRHYDENRYDENGKQRSLTRILWLISKRTLLESAVSMLIYNISQLSTPILIGNLVSSVTDGSEDGLYWSFVLLVVTLFGVLGNQRHLHLAFRVAQRLRGLLIALVYRRAIQLTSVSRKGKSTGDVVNLMSNDAQKVYDLMSLINLVWSAPLQIGVATFFLARNLGVSAIAGIMTMVILVPLNTAVVRYQAKLRRQHMELSDSRVRMCSEVLQGIRVVKFFGWEIPFIKRISDLRFTEIQYTMKQAYFFALYIFLMIIFPVYGVIATFATYVALGNTLGAAVAFSSLAFFNVLRFPLVYVGTVVTAGVQTRIAMKRLHKFLHIDSLDDDVNSIDYVRPSGGQSKWGTLSVSGVEIAADVNVDERLLLANGKAKTPQANGAKTSKKKSLGSESEESSGSDSDGENHDRLVTIRNGAFTWNHKFDGDAPSTVDPLRTDGDSDSDRSHDSALSPTTGKRKGGKSSDTKKGDFSAVVVSGEDTEDEEEEEDNSEAQRSFLLRDINMELHRGELIAVIGRVGSGKSTLVSSLVGDTMLASGTCKVRGSIAYVPQQAWILNATIRENVVFGLQWDEQWYREVLSACCLWRDLETLPAGDQTMIGERGVTLSGGQKQRISLARAAYSRADLVLIDDPLSALDSHTGRDVFDQVIGPQGIMSKSARLLITHAIQYLSQVNHVIMMSDGKPVYEGSFRELESMSGRRGSVLQAFLDTLKSSAQEKGKGDDDDGADDLEVTKAPRQELAAHSDKLMTEEERVTGNNIWRSLANYGKDAGGVPLVTLLMFIFTMERFTYMGTDWWLAQWTSSNDSGTEGALGLPKATDDNQITFWLVGYVAIAGCNTVFVLSRCFTFCHMGVIAAKKLFQRLLNRVMFAPMVFFDTTPIGRVVNRFSYDTEMLDHTLIIKLIPAVASTFWLLSGTILMIGVVPWMALAMVPVAYLYYKLQLYYRLSSRELQRLDSMSRSPINAHFSESLAGSPSIRAYGVTSRFILLNDLYVNQNNRAILAYTASMRWLGVRAELLGAFVIFMISLLTWLVRDTVSGGLAGLAILWALNFSISANFFVTFATEAEAKLTSVERVVNYADELTMEAPPTSENDSFEGAAKWPSKGLLEFKDVELRYRPELPLALRKVTARFEPGQHVGIVGRTGSGKSSLTVAIFRLTELCGGKILLDGVDLSTLGTAMVRGKGLCIIPQDPVLFSGTLRYNLDPFDEYKDAALWAALADVQMENEFEGAGLDTEITEGGANFSIGERQLICFARALLRQPKVMILDEATANIDSETDKFIQNTVRKRLRGTTLLIIAHRLHTIMDCDKVMVMREGVAEEYDQPNKLLADGDSQFSALVKSTGEAMESRLREVAAKAARDKGR